MLRLVEKADARGEGHQGLDELAREGARRMLVEALEAEVASYLEQKQLTKVTDKLFKDFPPGSAKEK